MSWTMYRNVMKNLAPRNSKTDVLHWRGCIFQGFQCLQKVGKTTPEIVSTCLQNPLKSGLEGSPKRSWKIQGQIKNTWRKKVSKMRSRKGILLMIFGTFLRSGSKGVPGRSQGPSQGPSRVKIGPKWISKWLKNHQQMWSGGFLKTLLKDTRTKHVSQ